MPDVFTVFLNKDDDDSSSMSPNFTDVCMVGAGHKLATRGSKIQRNKSKLSFTDELNACNKCIRVQRDVHRAVTELSVILIEGCISKFLHV